MANKCIKEEHMLPAADGTMLQTFVYKPKGTCVSWPCIVERSPYAGMLNGFVEMQADELCAHGYAYVVQMCRGVAGSRGKWEPNVNEREDGLSLLRWLDGQSWVESIGYKGFSYLALTGWVMADALPEKVKSMFLCVYGCDRFVSAYSSGMFRHDVLTGWAMQNAGFPVQADYLDSCRYLPQIEVDEALWGGRLDWYRDYISNPDNRDGYWSKGFWGMLCEIPKHVSIPLRIEEGWFDHHLASALKSYELLADKAKEKTVLEIGPWDHSFHLAADGYKDVMSNGDMKLIERVLDWFDMTLKREETPRGGVRYYHVGADEWKTSDRYPFEDKGGSVYGFDCAAGEKTLLRETAGSGTVEFTYDPANPVPSVGGESLLTTEDQRGSKLQPEPDYRPDVLSFLSSVLEEALDVTGKVRVKLRVASDAADTAFCVKLCEIMPDGKAYNLRTMISSLAYRNGAECPVSYAPGEFVELELESWDISWRFQKGSRIRLDVTSSDFPQYAAHPNCAGLWSEARAVKTARQKIDCGESWICFPAG